MKKSENKEDEIFIDRDPVLFARIYNFVKTGTVPTKLSHVHRNKLINEAQYYHIQELVEKLEFFGYPVEELDFLDREMREKEMVLRKLFSFDRTNPLLDDPHLSLISVFENIHLFFPIEVPPREN